MKTTGDRRREKLEWLKRKFGLTEIAVRSGLSPAALDQVLKLTLLEAKKDGSRSRKELGNKAARSIEAAFDLGVGWFDSDVPISEVVSGETRLSQMDTGSKMPAPPLTERSEIPVAMPYSAPNLKSAVLLMGSLLGVLDARSKSIIGEMLKDLAAHPDDAEDIANKASAIATVQQPIASDPRLDAAIKSRRAVETSHGGLR